MADHMLYIQTAIAGITLLLTFVSIVASFAIGTAYVRFQIKRLEEITQGHEARVKTNESMLVRVASDVRIAQSGLDGVASNMKKIERHLDALHKDIEALRLTLAKLFPERLRGEK